MSGRSYFFPRSQVHALLSGRAYCHLPKPIAPGFYPVLASPDGLEVANAPPGSMLFFARRLVDRALVLVYAPNNP